MGPLRAREAHDPAVRSADPDRNSLPVRRAWRTQISIGRWSAWRRWSSLVQSPVLIKTRATGSVIPLGERRAVLRRLRSPERGNAGVGRRSPPHSAFRSKVRSRLALQDLSARPHQPARLTRAFEQLVQARPRELAAIHDYRRDTSSMVDVFQRIRIEQYHICQIADRHHPKLSVTSEESCRIDGRALPGSQRGQAALHEQRQLIVPADPKKQERQRIVDVGAGKQRRPPLCRSAVIRRRVSTSRSSTRRVRGRQTRKRPVVAPSAVGIHDDLDAPVLLPAGVAVVGRHRTGGAEPARHDGSSP